MFKFFRHSGESRSAKVVLSPDQLQADCSFSKSSCSWFKLGLTWSAKVVLSPDRLQADGSQIEFYFFNWQNQKKEVIEW